MKANNVMSDIFQLPGYISSIKTMSNGLRLTVDTQENISGDAIKRLFDNRDQLGWFTFNVTQIEAENIVDLPELKVKDKITPSQKMRAVLYRLWEQDKGEHEDFNDYYMWYMDLIIDKLKGKLL